MKKITIESKCKHWTMIKTLNQGYVPYPIENFFSDDKGEYFQLDGKCHCGGPRRPPKK